MVLTPYNKSTFFNGTPCCYENYEKKNSIKSKKFSQKTFFSHLSDPRALSGDDLFCIFFFWFFGFSVHDQNDQCFSSVSHLMAVGWLLDFDLDSPTDHHHHSLDSFTIIGCRTLFLSSDCECVCVLQVIRQYTQYTIRRVEQQNFAYLHVQMFVFRF